MGIPYRVVVGEKSLAATPPQVEVKRRGAGESRLVDISRAAEELCGLVQTELAALNQRG
jgi:prolyl-tRNA synthetase